jgi:hypothetical protein
VPSAEVDDAVDPTTEATAVDEDGHLVRIGALHAHRAGAETELLVLANVEARDLTEDVLQVDRRRLFDDLLADHLGRNGHLPLARLGLRAGDDHLVERHRDPQRLVLGVCSREDEQHRHGDREDARGVRPPHHRAG